jgi:hypothetical protein
VLEVNQMFTSRRDLALLALPALCRAGTSAPDFRIGTYDSRAIAVAYAASRFNPVAAKMKEMQAAKAAGDEAKIKELESWGQAHQRQLHRQGFGRVPVDDLLAHVKGRLPEVASRAGVQAITMQCDWTAAGAEAVDLTDALVALFDPSPRTLNIVKDMKGKAPLPLEAIERHEH